MLTPPSHRLLTIYLGPDPRPKYWSWIRQSIFTLNHLKPGKLVTGKKKWKKKKKVCILVSIWPYKQCLVLHDAYVQLS